MRKFRFLSLMAVTAMLIGFASCSDDADVPTNGGNEIGKANASVRISVVNDPQTRAANDEVGDGDEVGIADEYFVKSATLYFFQSDLLVKEETFTGFQQEANDGKQVVWKSANKQIATGDYKVVILVNGKAAQTVTEGTTTYADFMKDLKTGADTWIASASNGLLMASRDNTGTSNDVTIDDANTPANPAIISATVERTVAKVMLADEKDNGYNYALPTEIAPATTITLEDYRMINLRNEYFSFRHVITGFTPVNPGTTTDNNQSNYTFGNLANVTDYVMDPKTFMKNTSMPTSISGVDYQDWVGHTKFSTVGDAESHILGYTQENTMHVDAQKKGYGTAIVFKGKIDAGFTIQAGENLYYDRTNSKFYGSYDDLKAEVIGLDDTGVNYKELAANSIDAYKDGYCTYVYYIKHADNNNDKVMGIMEYAMVRNNVYKVNVQGIEAPGKGLVPDPNDPTGKTPIDPADPDIDTTDPTFDPQEDIETDEITVALKVELKVMPWIIRANDVILK